MTSARNRDLGERPLCPRHAIAPSIHRQAVQIRLFRRLRERVGQWTTAGFFPEGLRPEGLRDREDNMPGTPLQGHDRRTARPTNGFMQTPDGRGNRLSNSTKGAGLTAYYPRGSGHGRRLRRPEAPLVVKAPAPHKGTVSVALGCGLILGGRLRLPIHICLCTWMRAVDPPPRAVARGAGGNAQAHGQYSRNRPFNTCP